VALLVAHYYEANPETDLLSLALGVMTFFYGALLGVFLVGFMTRDRGNTLSNAAGAVLSILLVVLVKQTTSVGWPWFIVLGTLASFAVSCLGRTVAAVADRYADLR
jgi:solute:Na+ symporter, SSS family